MPTTSVVRRTTLLAVIAAAVALARPGTARVRPSRSCEHTVALRGAPADVSKLEAALARYEVRRNPGPRCRGWAVTVSHAGQQLTLEIADGEGPIAVRQVRSMDVAAAVVDSWVHPENDVPLRPRRASDPSRVAASMMRALPATPAQAAPAADAGAGDSSGSPAAAATVPPPVPLPVQLQQRDHPLAVAGPIPALSFVPWTITVGPEGSTGNDGSRWWGGQIGVCRRVGRVCAGAMARADESEAVVGDPGTTRRYTADLLATVDVPFRLGAVTLLPGAGFGAGLLQANTSDMASPASEPSGARRSTTWGVRAMSRAVVSIPVRARFSVDVGAAIEVPLPARRPASDGQGGFYPADPRFYLRGELALRYHAAEAAPP